MTMTDPIADMLTRLRNANSAYHDTVGMPYSKIKSHIAEILQQEGYIAGWRVEDAEVGKNLVVTLKFGNQRERSIAGIKREHVEITDGGDALLIVGEEDDNHTRCASCGSNPKKFLARKSPALPLSL